MAGVRFREQAPQPHSLPLRSLREPSRLEAVDDQHPFSNLGDERTASAVRQCVQFDRNNGEATAVAVVSMLRPVGSLRAPKPDRFLTIAFAG